MAVKFLRAPTRKINPVRGVNSTRARMITKPLDDNATPYMDMVRSNSTKLQISDPFAGIYTQTDELTILQPKYPPEQLVRVGKENSSLSQCIDAYVVNIESYGYQLEYVGPAEKNKSSRADAQKAAAIDFLENINADGSLRTIRENGRRDLEFTGNRYYELGRNLAGQITFMDHVTALSMRKTKKDKERTTYTMPVRSSTGAIVYKTWSKNFCRFVQMSSTGQKIYFKEFGDPRSIDPKDGKVNGNLAVEDQATEIFHHALYSLGDVYGMPRWLGALPAMLGLRESEMVNLNFFRENAIPAMAVLISGGALTEESFEKVSEMFNAGRGREAMNKVLILEAAADDSVGNADQAPPVPRIDMKPMNDSRQTDGLFASFESDAKKKIRSAMRLPAIFTGDSEEYTKATAQAGQRIAESQVFYPERSYWDEFVNNKIFPTLGITMYKFKTMGPTAYDPESLGTLIDRFARHGAITPNTLVKIANQVLDVQIPEPEGEWGNVPFNYTLAMVAAGSQIEDFEDTFALINDATNPALAGGGGNPADDAATAPAGGAKPANDNAATKALVKRIIREQLHTITNDIINQINEHAAPSEDAA